MHGCTGMQTRPTGKIESSNETTDNECSDNLSPVRHKY